MMKLIIIAAVATSTAACAASGTRQTPEVIEATATAASESASASADQKSSGGRTEAAAPVDVLDLGSIRPGSVVEVQAGTVLDVTLEGNASTGFSWGYVDTGEGVIEDTGERSVTLSDSRRVGSGGTETRRLRALKPGRQTVIFEYRRPWETEVAPLRTRSWTIIVLP